jgi:nitroreductase
VAGPSFGRCPLTLATVVVMDALEALRTTGSVREFRPDPVTDDTVYRLLDTARCAPNGGNRQAWRVVVVHDRSIRRALRELYLRGWYEYLAMTAAGLVPWAPVTDRVAEQHAIAQAAEWAQRADPSAFAERLDEVPVLLVVLADLHQLAAVDRDAPRYTLAGGASIYPFCWSILLAARAEGLGGVLTTMATRHEPQVRSVLGVPEHLAVAALLALGRPVRQPTKLRRHPVETFATVDRWDGPGLGSRPHLESEGQDGAGDADPSAGRAART